MLRWLADWRSAVRREASVPPPPFKPSKRTAVIMYAVWYGRLTPAQAYEQATGWGFPPDAIADMIAQATRPPSFWSRHPAAPDAEQGAAPDRGGG